MKALCGLAFAFIIIIAVPNSAVGVESENSNTYNISIEVPKNDDDTEQFSSNVINSIGKLKKESDIFMLHVMLNFLLWDYSTDIAFKLYQQNKPHPNIDEMEYLGWFSLHHLALSIVKKNGEFKIHHIILAYEYFSKNHDYKMEDFKKISRYGALVKPYVDTEKSTQKKIETYNNTIKELLN
ncbi:hypothetical protein [uncultured Desulfovibrio sp.]|uniref:hypothetical protein n=1 Tax=uncultured Desulfovibrio sp. TaxID=167968 RepID=UPI002672A04B|nr:hypothetical protein [uncultured Desulfovibrio sp.]